MKYCCRGRWAGGRAVVEGSVVPNTVLIKWFVIHTFVKFIYSAIHSKKGIVSWTKKQNRVVFSFQLNILKLCVVSWSCRFMLHIFYVAYGCRTTWGCRRMPWGQRMMCSHTHWDRTKWNIAVKDYEAGWSWDNRGHCSTQYWRKNVPKQLNRSFEGMAFTSEKHGSLCRW